MHRDIEEVLLSQRQIADRVAELAREVQHDYQDKDPMFVGILKGCYVFMADFIRAFDAPCTVEFLSVTTYGVMRDGSSKLILDRDIGTAPMGRHIVLLEDMMDSGDTIRFVVDQLKNRGAASMEICTLLDKPTHGIAQPRAKYVGFTIPDKDVVGYGIDSDEHYRNLPYIGILRQKD